MDLKGRLKALCNHFGLSIREFERECQLNRGNISNMTGAIGSDKIAKIITRFPEIDIYWLLTGEGHMLRTIADVDQHAVENILLPHSMATDLPQQELICLLKEEITLLSEQIRLQREQIAEFRSMMEWIKKRAKFL